MVKCVSPFKDLDLPAPCTEGESGGSDVLDVL